MSQTGSHAHDSRTTLRGRNQGVSGLPPHLHHYHRPEEPTCVDPLPPIRGVVGPAHPRKGRLPRRRTLLPWSFSSTQMPRPILGKKNTSL